MPVRKLPIRKIEKEPVARPMAPMIPPVNPPIAPIKKPNFLPNFCIKFDNGWVPAYCPKLITLGRNEFMGPFKTKLEANEALRHANG